MVKDKALVQWFGRLERAAASPGSILALETADYESDVRHVLPSIRVPTLILHRKGDSAVPVAVGHYLAQNIAGAKYIELPGEDHLLQASHPICWTSFSTSSRNSLPACAIVRTRTGCSRP